MTDLSVHRLFTVYLLHWRERPGQVSHYVGITTIDRLEARMREHASGKGSRLTAALTATGQGFALARIFTTYNPELETTLISMGARLTELCPVCSGTTPLADYRATKKAAGLLPPLPSQKMLLALNVKPEPALRASQKRDGAEAPAPLPHTVHP